MYGDNYVDDLREGLTVASREETPLDIQVKELINNSGYDYRVSHGGLLTITRLFKDDHSEDAYFDEETESYAFDGEHWQVNQL